MTLSRDTLIAIVLGFGLGLLVTIFVLNFSKIVPKKEPTPLPEAKEEKVAPVSPTTAVTGLLIDYPKEDELFTANIASYSGKALSNSILVITTTEDETVTEVDNKGTFSGKIKLSEGVNEIKFSNLDEKGNTLETKTVTVAFEDEEF